MFIVVVQLSILGFFTTFIFPFAKLTTEQFYMFYSALRQVHISLQNTINCSDFYSGVNAYLLLAFSDALRTHIKCLILGKKPDTIVHSVISARTRSHNTAPEWHRVIKTWLIISCPKIGITWISVDLCFGEVLCRNDAGMIPWSKGRKCVKVGLLKR